MSPCSLLSLPPEILIIITWHLIAWSQDVSVSTRASPGHSLCAAGSRCVHLYKLTRLPDLIVMTHVCGFLRRHLLDTAGLWAQNILVVPQKLHEVLPRAGDLRLVVVYKAPSCPCLLDDLKDIWPRIEYASLSLDATTTSSSVIGQSAGGPIYEILERNKNFEQLKLTFVRANNVRATRSPPPPLVLQPKLHSLQLRNAQFLISGRNLRSLHLRANSRHLAVDYVYVLCALKECPELEQLSLRHAVRNCVLDAWEARSEPAVTTMTPVPLKRLRQFSCTGLPEDAVVMWRSLDAPSTVSIITESTFTGSITARGLVNPVIDLTIATLAQSIWAASFDKLHADVTPSSSISILPMLTIPAELPWVTLLVAAEQRADDTGSNRGVPFATIISGSTHADALMMCRVTTHGSREMPLQKAFAYTVRMLGIRQLAPASIAVCASSLLRSYIQILGAHSVGNMLIGPESWVPTAERDWREILQHPRSLVRLEIHGLFQSVQPARALALCIERDENICPELEEVVFGQLWPLKSVHSTGRILRLRLKWTGGKRHIEWILKEHSVV